MEELLGKVSELLGQTQVYAPEFIAQLVAAKMVTLPLTIKILTWACVVCGVTFVLAFIVACFVPGDDYGYGGTSVSVVFFGLGVFGLLITVPWLLSAIVDYKKFLAAPEAYIILRLIGR
jgi:uncharacterized membrane protein